MIRYNFNCLNRSRLVLTILLIDTELELIPSEMVDDYSIRIHAKKRKKSAQKIILDSNYMHTAIERFFPGESNRRGRPDILYHFLTVAMESILNKTGNLRVWVHARNDMIIEISPDIRLPKSYNRFVGLLEDLFDKEEIRTGEQTLLKIHRGDVRRLVEISDAKNLKILSPVGDRVSVTSFFENRNESDSVIIGGFSEGDFRSDVYPLGKSYSIFQEELTIWSVAMEIIAQYERANDLI